jgi:hypothetical protein
MQHSRQCTENRLIDRYRIIHASGKVRIDIIDHEGIYNEDVKKYTHKLRVIKRII